MSDRMKRYRFEIHLNGVGKDADEALSWVLEKISCGQNLDVVEGDIVYMVLDEEEKPATDTATEGWVAVLPEG
tara:strand:- start:10294 stop:10512 length:219 start_codon:yes stop_codon:yes gene_type:complete